VTPILIVDAGATPTEAQLAVVDMKALVAATHGTSLEHFLLKPEDNKGWESYNFRVIDGLSRGDFQRQAQALVDDNAYLKNVCGDLEREAQA
jgi:hypothetical protein